MHRCVIVCLCRERGVFVFVLEKKREILGAMNPHPPYTHTHTHTHTYPLLLEYCQPKITNAPRNAAIMLIVCIDVGGFDIQV